MARHRVHGEILQQLPSRQVTWLHPSVILISILSENNEVVEKPIKLASLSNKLVQKSVNFIKQGEGDSRPFLLYHSFAHVHTPLDTEDKFRGVSPHGRYGDVLSEVSAYQLVT